MQVQPYLFFEGRCQEALDFYRDAVGAEIVMTMHFKDAPDQSMIAATSRDKIMHAAFRIGETMVSASDGRCTGQSTHSGYGLSITAGSDAEAESLFAALGDGGSVGMPMAPTFFASRFGMLTDRFGVMWMVMHGAP